MIYKSQLVEKETYFILSISPGSNTDMIIFWQPPCLDSDSLTIPSAIASDPKASANNNQLPVEKMHLKTVNNKKCNINFSQSDYK